MGKMPTRELTRESLEEMFDDICRFAARAEHTHETNFLYHFQRVNEIVAYEGGKRCFEYGEMRPFVEEYVQLYNRDREIRQQFMAEHGYGERPMLREVWDGGFFFKRFASWLFRYSIVYNKWVTCTQGYAESVQFYHDLDELTEKTIDRLAGEG